MQRAGGDGKTLSWETLHVTPMPLPSCHRGECCLSRSNWLVPPGLLTRKSRAQGGLCCGLMSLLDGPWQAQTHTNIAVDRYQKQRSSALVHFCAVTQRKSAAWCAQQPAAPLPALRVFAFFGVEQSVSSKSIPVSFDENHRVFFSVLASRSLIWHRHPFTECARLQFAMEAVRKVLFYFLFIFCIPCCNYDLKTAVCPDKTHTGDHNHQCQDSLPACTMIL